MAGCQKKAFTHQSWPPIAINTAKHRPSVQIEKNKIKLLNKKVQKINRKTDRRRVKKLRKNSALNTVTQIIFVHLKYFL